jgi:FkbH-like protein
MMNQPINYSQNLNLSTAESNGSIYGQESLIAEITNDRSLSAVEEIYKEPKQTIAIAATFTAEPIQDYLNFWMQELEIPSKIEFAPYNQVFQQLLDPSSLLSNNSKGINVIFVNFEDWQKYDKSLKTFEDISANIEGNVRELLTSLQTAVKRSTTPHLLCLCPTSPKFKQDPQKAIFLQQMEKKIADEIASINGAYLLQTEDIIQTYSVEDYYDSVGNENGHISYTIPFYCALATIIARKIFAIKSKPYKVIALDCDNTLWKGVCGEVGAEGVEIDSAFYKFQKLLLQQQEAGMLLCLCSKNIEQDAIEVFQKREDMPLKLDRLVSWRINWQPKSVNLKSLAQELNLGIDSFIFIDDNPVECAEVEANCPEVLTLQLPQTNEEIEQFIKHTWVFDRLKVTSEDKKRTEQYQQNSQRERLRQETGSFDDFLFGLQLEIEIKELTPETLSRASQLTQRTNQFNMTTIRRSESEISQECDAGKLSVLTVEVKDRFGDYGLVGLLLYSQTERSICVDTFLLSCRVLGRGVEHKMLAQLGKIASDRGLERVDVSYVATQKNQPAFDFLNSVGIQFQEEQSQSYLYKFPVAYLTELSYSPNSVESKSSSNNPTEKIANTTQPNFTSKATLLKKIATELSDPNQSIDLIKAQKSRNQDEIENLVLPRNPLEQKLVKLWEEALGVSPIGIHDNFFELGGDSIKAAVLINKLQEQIGEIFHFIILFDAPTIAELAEYLNNKEPEAIAKMIGVAIDPETVQNNQSQQAIDAARVKQMRRLIPSLSDRQDRVRTKNKPALFVLSPPRSGSTLFRVMLSGNPQLFAPPELHLLGFNNLEERKKYFSGERSFWAEGNIRALMEIRDCSVERAQEIMQQLEAQKLSIQEYYALMQEWIGDRILVDKTPPYALDLKTIERAESDFENTLYIHLMRHPYGMIRSHEESRMEQLMTNLMGLDIEPPFNRREYAELVWTICQQNILQFLKTIPPQRKLLVKFEDLVQNPQITIEGICEFLGLDFHPDMVQPYRDKNQRMTDGVNSTSRMMGDMKFKNYSGIDPQVAEKWRKNYTQDFLGDVTWEIAKNFGYEPIQKEQTSKNFNSLEFLEQKNPQELLSQVDRLSDREVDNLLNRMLTKPETKRALLIQLLKQEENVKRPSTFPLSFGQERLWALDRLENDSCVYNLTRAIRLKGILNLEVLQKSLNEIVRRHEILRTSFQVIDGKPMQSIAAELDLQCPVVDLQQLDPEKREVEAQRSIDEFAKQPFVLTQLPLLRVKLLRLSQEEHILIRVSHHIIFDGWSTRLFPRELAAIYEAFLTGKSSPLPDLPIQYGDYVLWQRKWSSSEVAQSQLAYWQKKLAGKVPVLQLPTDKLRPGYASSKGASQLLVLPKQLVKAIENLSRQEKVTPFMVLLAAFKTFLNRYSGQEDLIVCSPVACRNRSEIESLIGYFNNIVVMRTDLSGNPSFRKAIALARQVASEAFQNQDLPFQKITELPNLRRTPLTRCMFALQSTPSEPEVMSQLIMTSQEIDKKTADCDLSLFIEPKEETLVAAFEYKTDLFSDEAIEKMKEHFQHHLESLVADPDLRLASLPVLKEPNNALSITTNIQAAKSQNNGNGKAKILLAPRDDIEFKLKQIWEQVLDIQSLDIRDDFFALGGHSMLAVRLFAEIEKALGKKLPLAILFQAPTIEQLAKAIREEARSLPLSSLVPIKPNGSKKPLFLIHARGTSVLLYRDLAYKLDPEQPVYGLQPKGLYEGETPLKRVEDMASLYIKEIQTIQPNGPYLLGGYSFGGDIAMEMAQQLCQQGQQISMLALFDCRGPNSYVRSPLSKRLLIHIDNLIDRKHLYVVERVKDWKRWLGDMLKYKLQKLVMESLQYLDLNLPLTLRNLYIEDLNIQAAKNYQHEFYPGKIILLRTIEWLGGVGCEIDEKLGWGELVGEGVEVYDVPGHHLSMFEEPHVQKLAATLKVCIEKAQS